MSFTCLAEKCSWSQGALCITCLVEKWSHGALYFPDGGAGPGAHILYLPGGGLIVALELQSCIRTLPDGGIGTGAPVGLDGEIREGELTKGALYLPDGGVGPGAPVGLDGEIGEGELAM
jgi:hypothetical protein